MSIALYPGVFDPVTYGHLHLAKQLSKKYEKVIIAVGNNESKNDYMIPIVNRVKLFEKYANCKNVIVKQMDGLLVDFANKKEIDVIYRGVRNDNELKLQNEFKLRYKNEFNGLQPIEFIFAKGKYKFISSTLVKDYIKRNKDISNLTPVPIDVITSVKRS
jgi:pantetheine-phosphate adenylyltransferase